MKKNLLFIFFSVLIQNAVFSQNIGDFKSVGTGNWTTLSSWLYYNGSVWVTPTVLEGYPGQYTGTGAVLIQNGSTINIGTSGIATQPMGTITISGSLVLTGVNTGGTGTDYNFNTTSIVVTPLLGTITFINKVNLKLPANAILQVTTDATPNPDYFGLIGDCNHNQDIYIGTDTYAYCNGGGSTGLTFIEVMNGGGSLNAIATSNSPICEGETINLVGNSTGVSGVTVTYTWSIKDPNNITTTTSVQNPIITNAIAGTYVAKLTCNVIYNGNPYSNFESINVIVNAKPTTPLITAGSSTTFCEGGSVVLTSSVASSYLWSTGEVTQSITPTVAGNYTVMVTNANGCQSLSSLGTVVTVNALPLPPTGIASQSFCSDPSTTVASLSATGSGILWYAVSSGGTVLTTSTALVNGNHYYASQTVNGCESASRFDVAVTVTVGAPSIPLVPSTLSLVCSATSFYANWSASSSATKYYIDVATDAAFSTILPLYNNKDLGNVLSENVTGLTTSSTFYVRLQAVNSCGSSGYSSAIVVSLPTTTYSSGSWSNGVPSASNNRKAIFASNYSITTELDACSCQINSGVNVVVGTPGGLNDTAILKLENGLDVLGTATLTFENNASLVQVNDNAINTGTIIYKRISAPMKNFDFTYWSSPVKDQVLNILSPNTFWDKYYSYASNKWVTENGNNKMNPAGKGFIIRVPKPNVTYPNGEYWTGTTYSQPVKFVGVPNNGIVSVPVLAGQNNLIGNPYPSAVDAETFMEDNASVIYGALYFWTHNSAPTQTGTVYSYASNDYAVFNISGGTAATTGGSAPSGQIASGQSFFVGSKIAGNFVFNNAMRISAAGSNSQFFKMNKTKRAAKIEKNRVWLNLTNSGGVFKQLLVGYIAGATNGLDNLYDGISFNGNSYVDFYSVDNEKMLTIQGRALPFDQTDEVPLGYKTSIAGIFEISIDKVDGALVDQNIFIEDKVTGDIVDLKKRSYSFSTAIGIFNDRFVLRYIDNNLKKNVLSTNKSDLVNQSLLVSVKKHQININSSYEILDKVMVYDLNGRLLYKKENVNDKEFTIPEFNFSEQFLVVLVQLANEEWVTKEIIFSE
ncbi:T9SS sorting signal type C domain-containing protein [Flavobacterium taihuense]|uniref:T9SS sorting signal type C domain-containing protein n=1 Tax=Flavobacterium taihuense TaxID=2857508 RepID=A0ABS6XXW0_9FLAO|nr:T9SS sorting signal type C domain-containing protein [Flavobacterium taihuense]MBW4361111.1 T9SS sorting signal type C domain-containing protein [Flavobacterium taihuense]